MSSTLAMMLGMAVGSDSASSEPRARPPGEVLLYTWPDYRIVRVTTQERLDQIRDESMEFSERKGLYNIGDTGAVFVMMERSGNAVAEVHIKDLKDTAEQFRLREFDFYPQEGLDRFSVDAVITRKRGSISTAAGLTPHERDLLASFLFGWLGLNPQWMDADARLYLHVPYATLPYGPWRETPDMPGGFKNERVPKSRSFRHWAEEFKNAWFGGPEGNVHRYSNAFPKVDTITMSSAMVELLLKYKIGTRIENGEPVMDERDISMYDPSDMTIWIYWQATGWSSDRFSDDLMIRSGWHHTPLEAISEVSFLVTPDELETWLDEHFIPGQAVLSDEVLEGFELLGEDPPPLWRDDAKFDAFMAQFGESQ